MEQKDKDFSLIHYRGCIPEILRYQIITKLWMMFFVWLLRLARGGILWTTDRSAITSGDIPFLMRSVQGWGLMILGVAMLLIYVVFDINAMIILSSRVLHQRPIRIREILQEAFASLKQMKQPFGVMLLLYVAFLIPLAGVGLGISLTERLYVPRFVTSFIEANWFYHLIYNVLLLAILVVSVYYLFTFHCIVIGKMDASAARKRAGRMMRENWKDFFSRYVSFLVRTVIIGFFVVILLSFLLLVIASLLKPTDVLGFRTFIALSAYVILVVAFGYSLLFTPFQFIELTRIYESYTEEDEGEMKFPPRQLHVFFTCLSIILVVGIVIGSRVTAREFDDFFPVLGNTQVIAHRGGGNLGNENTVLGLQKAIQAGADASEIDVQRTQDGYYVVNHDDTLFRLSGDTRKVTEVTLSELQKLKVKDEFNLLQPEVNYATYEDMLEASRDRIHLYVELKGKSADAQMAEDLYQMTKEKQMLDQVTFICLKYPLISELELKHPDAQTGYLCFASFGNIQDLDVDELILEEETATPANIARIHEAGKKVTVWTVNTLTSMLRFYARNVDAVITDEVESCLDVREGMRYLTDNEYELDTDVLQRVLLKTVFVWWP